MQLTLAQHPVADLRFGTNTRLDGTTLSLDRAELCDLINADPAVESVDLEIVRPGENCRAGPIFDIVEPRAKESAGTEFPGILGGIPHRGHSGALLRSV